MISNVVSTAEGVLPGAVLSLYWGDNLDQVVSVLRSESTTNDDDADLGGIIAGTRGRLRVILSRCEPWTPPQEGDRIALYDGDGDEIGTFVVLEHVDDPTGTVRSLIYGEEAA